MLSFNHFPSTGSNLDRVESNIKRHLFHLPLLNKEDANLGDNPGGCSQHLQEREKSRLQKLVKDFAKEVPGSLCRSTGC